MYASNMSFYRNIANNWLELLIIVHIFIDIFSMEYIHSIRFILSSVPSEFGAKWQKYDITHIVQAEVNKTKNFMVNVV